MGEVSAGVPAAFLEGFGVELELDGPRLADLRFDSQRPNGPWFDGFAGQGFAVAFLAHRRPPRSSSHRRPFEVKRYRCLLLRGLSGIVISIRLAATAGSR
jgi:hypothetical protein